MKNTIVLAILSMATFFIPGSFYVSAEEAESSTENPYLWDNIVKRQPDKYKYTICEFKYGTYEGTDIKIESHGGAFSITAQQIRQGVNDAGYKELTIIMPYLTISADLPGFLLRRSERGGNDNRLCNGTLFYPADVKYDITDYTFQPESGERYKLAETKDNLLMNNPVPYFMIGAANNHTYNNSFDGFVHYQIYNVIVTIEFDESDTDFETPIYITFNYNTDTANFSKEDNPDPETGFRPVNQGKPVFIGTLAQTSEKYKEMYKQYSPYGGWTTWVPFESESEEEGYTTNTVIKEVGKYKGDPTKTFDERSFSNQYPFTYTFTAEKEEYDFAIFLEVDRPYSLGAYNLMAGDKELYRYLSFWSDEYDFSANFGQKEDKENYDYVNIKSDLGITKPFPGNIGPDYFLPEFAPEKSYTNMTKSIHLSGLNRGRVYQLKIGRTSTINWYIQDGRDMDREGESEFNLDTRPYVSDAMAWVSLMEYTPEIKGLQLVKYIGEDEGTADNLENATVYYTFDAAAYKDEKKPLGTYKIVLNENNKIVGCDDVTEEINEREAYKTKDYLFTNKILVRTFDPAWMRTNDEKVDVMITNIVGRFCYEQNGEPNYFDALFFGDNEDNYLNKEFDYNGTYPKAQKFMTRQLVRAFAYSVIEVEDVNNPLDEKTFTLVGNPDVTPSSEGVKTAEGFTYSYNSDFSYKYQYSYLEYEYNDDGNLKKENGKPIYSVIPRNDAPEHEVVIASNEMNNYKTVEGTGRLGIPTPIAQNVEYLLDATTESVIGNNEKKDISIMLHLNDRYPAETTGETNENHPETLKNGDIISYTLPEKALHSHNYNIIYKTDGPNITDDFSSLIKERPVVEYSYYIDNDTYRDANSNDPGFYNAFMGDIYNPIINEEEESVSRTLNLKFLNPDHVVYDRWTPITATVEFKEQPPTITLKKSSKNKDIDDDSNLPDKIYSSFIVLDAINNTDDYLTVSEDGEVALSGLITGNPEPTVSEDVTTLYLVEYFWYETSIDSPKLNDATLKKDYALVTYDELIDNKRIFVDTFKSSSASIEGFLQERDSHIEKDQNEKGFVNPLRIRNIYLFPNKNPGLSFAVYTQDINGMSRLITLAEPLAADNSFDYHGITTTPYSPKVFFNETQSGLTDIESVSKPLAVSRTGAIEVISENAEVYGIDGTLIARGNGIYFVDPGMYIVTDRTCSAKLIVK